MKRHIAIVVLLITLLVAGCSTVSAQEEQKPAAKPEVNLPSWYRIDITLNEFEDGKKSNTRAYTLQAEGNGRQSEMKLGDRVPVATGTFGTGGNQLVNTQFQYIDVGLAIRCSVTESYGRLGIYVSAEQSSVTLPGDNPRGTANEEERWLVKQPVIRQLRMENRASVTLGKPTLIASVDDPGKANHRYTVEATVNKLNP